MSTRTDILLAVQAWLKTGAAAVPLTDDQVVPANAKRPRPALPYLTMLVRPDRPVGVDETRYSDDGEGGLNARAHGHRQAFLEINGYGAETFDWIERSTLALSLPSTLGTLTAAGLTIWAESETRDLSALLDNAIEPRAQRDFRIAYELVSDPDPVVPAVEVAVALTYPPAPDLEHTLTIEVD